MKRALAVLILGLAACDDARPKRPAVPEGILIEKGREGQRQIAEARAKEPKRVVVRHILLAFKGAKRDVPGVTRSREEAESLARDLVERIKGGSDMVELVRQHSDDKPRPGSDPGIYRIVNDGVKPGAGEQPRTGLVEGFGKLAFSLDVGATGLCEYDPAASPYGWHVIHRLE